MYFQQGEAEELPLPEALRWMSRLRKVAGGWTAVSHRESFFELLAQQLEANRGL